MIESYLQLRWRDASRLPVRGQVWPKAWRERSWMEGLLTAVVSESVNLSCLEWLQTPCG